MLNKLVKSLALLFFFFFVTGFSDIKQKDDYTCAPSCAANCIINYGLFPNDVTYDVPDEEALVLFFKKEAKTNSKGTKTNNLCKALKKYFDMRKRMASVKYDGIRPVDKAFRADNAIDIAQELTNGKSIILNIGVYELNDDVYKRRYGHYINVIDINEKGQFLVSDPYYNNGPYYIDINYLPPVKIIHNKDDNERVIKNDFQYQKIVGIPYLNKNEAALLNGVITVNLLVF